MARKKESSLDAPAGREDAVRGKMEHEQTTRSNHRQLVWVWKHSNSLTSRARRCYQQLSAAVGTPTVNAQEQGDSIISLRAVGRVKPGKTRKLSTLYKIIIVQMGWLPGEVEMDNQEHNQFDPGGSIWRSSCFFWRAAYITDRQLRL